MSDMLECAYDCEMCGKHTFDVRYRDPGEDVVHWMENAVRPTMSEHHAKQNCPNDRADLKIPMPKGAHGVGERVLS
jgi:hypothetical protein